MVLIMGWSSSSNEPVDRGHLKICCDSHGLLACRYACSHISAIKLNNNMLAKLGSFSRYQVKFMIESDPFTEK